MNFTKNTLHSAQARVRTKKRERHNESGKRAHLSTKERNRGRESERGSESWQPEWRKKCRSNEHVSSCRSTWQQWSERWNEVRYVVLWWVGVGVGSRVERHTSTNKFLDYVTLPTKYIDNITHTPPSSLSAWVSKPASQQQQQTAVDSLHSAPSLSLLLS